MVESTAASKASHYFHMPSKTVQHFTTDANVPNGTTSDWLSSPHALSVLVTPVRLKSLLYTRRNALEALPFGQYVSMIID